MCAAFRLLEVTEAQSNECEYPVSSSVQFRPEQISAVTDLGLEHFQPDHTNTALHLPSECWPGYVTSRDGSAHRQSIPELTWLRTSTTMQNCHINRTKLIINFCESANTLIHSQHLSDHYLAFCFFKCGMRWVTLLPQKLSRSQKRLRMLEFPPL